MNELDKVIDKLLYNIGIAADGGNSCSADNFSMLYQRLASASRLEAIKKQWDVVFALATALNTAIEHDDVGAMDNYSKAIQRILSVQCS
jgi:hypothetical protein